MPCLRIEPAPPGLQIGCSPYRANQADVLCTIPNYPLNLRYKHSGQWLIHQELPNKNLEMNVKYSGFYLLCI